MQPVERVTANKVTKRETNSPTQGDDNASLLKPSKRMRRLSVFKDLVYLFIALWYNGITNDSGSFNTSSILVGAII